MTIEATSNAETEETGAPSILAALLALKMVQETRVSTWLEYEDAITAHLTPTPSNPTSKNDSGQILDPSTTNGDGESHSHSHGNEGHSHSHYTSPTKSLDSGIMSEILRLVTSSLLDCSHQTRAIQVELETKFHRKDLGDRVRKVQDLENGLLRKVVERDQVRKVGQLIYRNEQDSEAGEEGEGGEETDKRERESKVKGLQDEIKELKEEIEEEMSELRAEIAELSEI